MLSLLHSNYNPMPSPKSCERSQFSSSPGVAPHGLEGPPLGNIQEPRKINHLVPHSMKSVRRYPAYIQGTYIQCIQVCCLALNGNNCNGLKQAEVNPEASSKYLTDFVQWFK